MKKDFHCVPAFLHNETKNYGIMGVERRVRVIKTTEKQFIAEPEKYLDLCVKKDHLICVERSEACCVLINGESWEAIVRTLKKAVVERGI